MFDNYVTAKTQKRRKWVSVLITTSVVIHVVGLVALLIRGFWVIEKLAPPKRELALAVAPPPPPPPPPPPASKRKPPDPDKKVIKKVKPQDTTQPVEKKPDEPEVEVEVVDSLDEGVEGGVEGGVAGGVVGGVIGGTLEGLPGGVMAPPPPPPAPEPPKIVPQVAVEQQRISGEKEIVPDEATKLQLKRDGLNQIVANIKMCLSADGSVSSLNFLKPSGYPDYDRKIQGKMRQWRYKPFLVNGKAVPVCTSVTFIYRQS